MARMTDSSHSLAASGVQIQGFALGPFATNCYVIHVPPEPSCWIIDASFEPDPLIAYIRANDLTPERIILTHAHVDHIAGRDAVLLPPCFDDGVVHGGV